MNNDLRTLMTQIEANDLGAREGFSNATMTKQGFEGMGVSKVRGAGRTGFGRALELGDERTLFASRSAQGQRGSAANQSGPACGTRTP